MPKFADSVPQTHSGCGLGAAIDMLAPIPVIPVSADGSSRGDNQLVFITIAVLLAIFVIPDPWRYPVVGLAVIAEVAETFFWMRLLRRQPVNVGAEALIGTMARVIAPCHPIGEVRVHGEVWQARCDAGADVGQRVRVRARDGLTLLVEHAP